MNSNNGITWADSVGGTTFSTEGFEVAYGTSGDGTPMWVAVGDDKAWKQYWKYHVQL